MLSDVNGCQGPWPANNPGITNPHLATSGLQIHWNVTPSGTNCVCASLDLLLPVLWLRFFLIELTTPSFRTPSGTNCVCASLDLLLPVLSIKVLLIELTTPSFRTPSGTNYVCASLDLLLPVLSIKVLFDWIDNTVFSQPKRHKLRLCFAWLVAAGIVD